MLMKFSTLLSFFLFLHSNVGLSQSKEDVFDIARNGTVEQVKEIVKVNPNAFNAVNEEGYSPLILACYRGNNEVAKLLIELNSDINGNSKMGTPLMAAIVKGNNEMATLLLEKKADVNIFDENGTTALIYAVMFQNKKLVALLLENKADKTHKDKKEKTPFEYAVFSGNQEIINLLK
jgi:uncharacterized protein